MVGATAARLGILGIVATFGAVTNTRTNAMKVKVERIRRGRRRPEVDYVEVGSSRKRRPFDGAERGGPDGDPWDQQGSPSQRLRLPWRIIGDTS
jgi:hypothetical protein